MNEASTLLPSLRGVPATCEPTVDPTRNRRLRCAAHFIVWVTDIGKISGSTSDR